MQYLCAAVEDKNLKHAVANQRGAGGAPDALAWLQNAFLQGVEFQPSLNAILDNMSLGSKESLIAFKARFMKTSDEIQPALPPAILCQKFNTSIKRHSGSSFDDCITTASAVTGHRDFEDYALQLTKLCSQKRALTQETPHDSQMNALATRMDALASAIQESQRPGQGGHAGGGRGGGGRGRGREQSGKGGKGKGTRPSGPIGKGGKGKRLCFNCGKAHEGKCTAEPACCTFVLPNGEQCKKQHLRQFCFYEDPSRCQDARVREIIVKKLEAMKTSSMAGNATRVGTYETFCMELCDTAPPPGSVDPNDNVGQEDEPQRGSRNKATPPPPPELDTPVKALMGVFSALAEKGRDEVEQWCQAMVSNHFPKGHIDCIRSINHFASLMEIRRVRTRTQIAIIAVCSRAIWAGKYRTDDQARKACHAAARTYKCWKAHIMPLLPLVAVYSSDTDPSESSEDETPSPANNALLRGVPDNDLILCGTTEGGNSPREEMLYEEKEQSLETERARQEAERASTQWFQSFYNALQPNLTLESLSIKDPEEDINSGQPPSSTEGLDLLADGAEHHAQDDEGLPVDNHDDELFISHQYLALLRAAVFLGKEVDQIQGLLSHLISLAWGSDFLPSGIRPLCAAMHIADMSHDIGTQAMWTDLAGTYGVPYVEIWEWKNRLLDLYSRIKDKPFGDGSMGAITPITELINLHHHGEEMQLSPWLPRIPPVTPPPSRMSDDEGSPPEAPGAPFRAEKDQVFYSYVTDMKDAYIQVQVLSQTTLPRDAYVVKWREWILSHLLSRITTCGNASLDNDVISLISKKAMDEEATPEYFPKWESMLKYRAAGEKAMVDAGYSDAQIDRFTLSAFPTKIESQLSGAQEMYESRAVMESFQSSVPTSKHEGSLDYVVVDTGATGHLVNDKRLIDPSKHTPHRVRIRTGLGECFSESIGPVTFIIHDVNGQPVKVTREAVYCPNFAVNLFSPASDFELHGTRVEFNDALTLTLSDGTTIPFRHEEGAYRVYYEIPELQAHVTITDPAMLWHHRLGHPPYSVLQKLTDSTVGPTFKLTEADAKKLAVTCGTCPQAKMKALPHKRSTGVKLATAFGDCVHMDLVGPLPRSNPHGYQFGSIFVDQYSLHYGGYCLRLKSEHESIHKTYCSDMSAYGGMSIQEFHSDNGGEFIGTDYSELIRENGARKTTSVARTPNQNPYAEGAFWKIFGIVRAVLAHAGLPHNLWSHAYVFACYILNRTPRVVHGDTVTTSYELLNKRKPNLSHIKIFGCVAHAVTDKTERGGKLNSVAISGIHLGPARYQRGWIIWIPGENRFIVARNVRFEESMLYKDGQAMDPPISSQSSAPLVDDEGDEDVEEPSNVNQIPPRPRRMCLTPGCHLARHHLGNHTAEQPATGVGLPSANLRARAPAGPTAGVAAPPVAAPEQDAGPDADLDEEDDQEQSPEALAPGLDGFMHTNLNMPIEIMMADLYDESPTKEDVEALVSIKESRLMKDSSGNFKAVVIPKGYHQMRFSPEYDKWLKAMKEEIDSHSKAGTWKLILAATIPKGRRPIGSTWSYDVKRNADGTVNRYKARFCAQGFSQMEGFDYYHTYSNTVRMDTLRMLLAGACAKSYFLTGADVKTAYLNGTLDEKIYMRQPQGFEQNGPNGEPMVCELKKSIYGLKQSGACWERCLLQELKKIGFTRCEGDPCLYKLQKGKSVLFLTTYVDDLLFASSDLAIRTDVMARLNKVFEVKDTGILTWFLNTAIRHERIQKRIEIDQSLYIEDLMHTFLPGEVDKPRKAPSLPCTEQILSLPTDLPPEQVDARYRSGVGKLNWLVTMTRFDLAFAVSTLARFNHRGGAPHMEMLLNTIRYAFNTRHYKLCYGTGRSETIFENFKTYSKISDIAYSEESMIFMTDASHGGEKPMAGNVGIIFGGPFAWAGFRLPQTSLSSCDAEYCAATIAVTTIVSTRPVWEFIFNEKLTIPTILFCDNVAAVLLSENNTSSRRLKHIATRIAYLRETVKDGHVQLHHIMTNGMIADLFTKPLGATQFHYLRRLLMA